MRCPLLLLLIVRAALVGACMCGGASAQEPAKIDFARDVQPLFKAHCTGCHGPKKQNNGFRLDRRRDAMRGGTMNMIGPGNGDGSRLYLRLIGDTVGLQMPPEGPLGPEQITVIKTWIDQGPRGPTQFPAKPCPRLPIPRRCG